MPQDKHRLVLLIEAETYDKIRQEAFDRRISVAEIVRKLVDQHLEAQKN